ncbi:MULTISPECIES: Bug family tripartite tricarboxylate transporter substrate binding protein [Mangrovibacter]|uniref:Tripartite-type tricarboxylate transporter receptor subunit TctC n=1 Tax=Mangrovibacter plantisponsor TaxID=451513 RepID=A0A317Q797_9ENTR|nr:MULTISPECIES: tripartite tricarboxylate transporter substrate binding protein [Mangrovibacter]KEA50946.1 hypothetical protein DT73_20575 [Mangrovibacter sp. MFB070]PWW11630.1 tripartite-type tricarboxylate transporter receptor subunit TctC [Mangrovibacter plantisponsor]
MSLTRRAFVAGATACLAAPFLSYGATAPTTRGELVFGYGRTGIGSVLAEDMIALIAQTYDKNRYHLVNLPGDNSLRAVETVKTGDSDGSVLLQAQSPQMTLLPSIYRSLPYDPLADFRPLAIMGEYTLLLTLGKLVDPEVKTLDGFLEWVLRNPEYRNLGFTQYGSSGQVAQAIIAHSKEVALQPVAYYGSSMMIDDLRRGYLSAGLVIAGNSPESYTSGELRAVAVTSKQRHPGWENVATCREQGVADMDINGWYGWFAPASIPDRVYEPLHDAIHSGLESRDYQQVLARYSLKPVDLTPKAIRERIREEQDYYASMVDSYQIRRV